MENLFILLQKNKKVKRQIQILKYLSSGELISADKIATDLEISRATLTSDINDLADLLADDIVIDKDFRKGYHLVYPNGTSINYYVAQIARTTLVYKIIDNLFHGNEQLIGDLADELYTSESVLLRLIMHMNKILATYHISISTHWVKFNGEEADIRTFLFAFYRTFMDYYAVKPVDEIYEHNYTRAIDDISNYTLHLNHAKVFLWTVISRVRISKQYFIAVKENLYAMIVAKKNYIHYKKIYLSNLNKLKVEFKLTDLDIPEAEIIWAYIVTLDCIEYAEKNEIEYSKSDLSWQENETDKHDQIITSVNDIMHSTFNLDTTHSAKYKTIIAYIQNIELLSKLSDNFQKVSIPLKNNIQESYPETYKKWWQTITKCSSTTDQMENLEDLAVTLTMLTIPLLNVQKTGTLNLLFSFESEAGYSAILVEASKLLMVPGLNVTYVFSSAVAPEFIKKHKIDILVSNFIQRNEENLDCKIIHLSYLPTLVEWMHLRNEIFKLL